MSYLCLPCVFIDDAGVKSDIGTFFMAKDRKKNLKYLRQLVIWLLDSKAPVSTAAWNSFRQEVQRNELEHPTFDILRSMLSGKWSPPSGRNWLSGWAEFGAALHSVYLLTHESLPRHAAEAVVSDCATENSQRNAAVKGRIFDDGERQGYKDRDFCDAEKWTKYKAWVVDGAFGSVLDIVNAFEAAAVHRTHTHSTHLVDKLNRLVAMMQSLPTPPGHTLKKDRDRQAREAAAAAVAAREAAVANGGDEMDADFGEVKYEPGPAAPATAPAAAADDAGSETGDEEEGAEPLDASAVVSDAEDDGRVSPVLKIGIPAYDDLSGAPAPVEGPSLPMPVLERTESFAIAAPSPLGPERPAPTFCMLPAAAAASLAPPSALGKRKASESLTEAEFEAEDAKLHHLRTAAASMLVLYAHGKQSINAAGHLLAPNLGAAVHEAFEEAKKLIAKEPIATPSATADAGGSSSAP